MHSKSIFSQAEVDFTEFWYGRDTALPRGGGGYKFRRVERRTRLSFWLTHVNSQVRILKKSPLMALKLRDQSAHACSFDLRRSDPDQGK